MIDLQVNQFIDNMPHYLHVRKEMNWKRFWTDVQKGNCYCNPAAYKNSAREKIALFTSPSTIVIPNSVIVKRANLKKFGNRTSVSFLELLGDNRLKGGLESSRSYSATLDQILKEHEQGSNISRRLIDIERHLLLLKYDRLDYILEYPIVVNYAARNMNLDPDLFASLSIQELPVYAYGYIACPRNEWGHKVVADLDRVLKDLLPTPAYQTAITKWYGNEREKKIVIDALRELISKHPQQ